jgi:hypothetical protein
MNDCAERGRTQRALRLGEIPKLMPAESQAESGVRAVVVGRLLLKNPEAQAERFHSLDRVGEDVLFGLLASVH